MARAAEGEPKPLTKSEGLAFEEGDFHGLSEGLCGDAQYNDARLKARRRLAALAKGFCARAKDAGTALESRTSLHNPNQFNGKRVRRLWAYCTRPKAEKKRLRSVLGADLAKDLDAAYRNAYLCFALEADALEVSMRIHPDGWYDGQNLVKRVAKEGQRPLLELLNALPGFQLKLADWKGEWRCGALEPEKLEEFLGYYQPGDHALAVEMRLPAPPGNRGVAFDPGTPDAMVEQALALLPLYRWCAWSEESDFLFG